MVPTMCNRRATCMGLGMWAYQSPSLGILGGGSRWCSFDVYIYSST